MQAQHLLSQMMYFVPRSQCRKIRLSPVYHSAFLIRVGSGDSLMLARRVQLPLASHSSDQVGQPLTVKVSARYRIIVCSDTGALSPKARLMLTVITLSLENHLGLRVPV
jgi:hypothetical protein